MFGHGAITKSNLCSGCLFYQCKFEKINTLESMLQWCTARQLEKCVQSALLYTLDKNVVSFLSDQ